MFCDDVLLISLRNRIQKQQEMCDRLRNLCLKMKELGNTLQAFNEKLRMTDATA